MREKWGMSYYWIKQKKIVLLFLFSVQKIGCFGDDRDHALPGFANLAYGKDTPMLLKNVQSCRDIALRNGADVWYFSA